MTILEVEKLAVYYGDVQAIWDVSFAVEKGQLVSILGANGAGKTTTLRTISGLIQPTRGSISFQNRKISGLASYEVADAGIAMVPEGRQLFPQLNVEDNLRMGSYLKRARPKREKILKYVYELFPPLAERRAQEAQTLSGGEQQMLAIGRALMQDPEMIMFDEPSLGLAPLLVQEVFRIIQELADQGRTILLVEQNVHQALKISDYCYVLENGRIVLEGTGKEMEADEKIREAYLGI